MPTSSSRRSGQKTLPHTPGAGWAPGVHSAARHPLKLDIEKRLRTALPAKGTPRRDNDSAHEAIAKRTNVLPSRTENLAV